MRPNQFQQVIHFWFNEIDSKYWFKKSPEFDLLIKTRFSKTHAQAAAGELFHWRENPKGRLAEIIVLDQFSRNIFRDTPKAFETDNLALTLAQEAIKIGADRSLTQQEKLFMYMPYMHSESKIIHKEAVKIFTELGAKGNLEYELAHKKIIDQFGRYPHRNNILGRNSTPEEVEFLKGPNSSF